VHPARPLGAPLLRCWGCREARPKGVGSPLRRAMGASTFSSSCHRAPLSRDVLFSPSYCQGWDRPIWDGTGRPLLPATVKDAVPSAFI